MRGGKRKKREKPEKKSRRRDLLACLDHDSMEERGKRGEREDHQKGRWRFLRSHDRRKGEGNGGKRKREQE